MKFTLNAKTVYFIERLKRRVAKGKREGIYSVAGLIRTTARSLLKIRQGSSRPGAIPHAHTRAGLRVIQFHVSESGNEAIIGPVKFPYSNKFSKPVPQLQETGGVVESSRGNRYDYPKRPYMSVAIRRLQQQGAIPRQFSVKMGRIL